MNTDLNFTDRGKLILGIVAIALISAAFSQVALAQHDRGARASRWHGDIARFHENDWRMWHGGRWSHSRHDGRLGWWWVVGSMWYFYPAPVYPYPSPWEPPPEAMLAPPAPPTQYWYYCEASRNYYPYVSRCPGGWQKVPASPVNP